MVTPEETFDRVFGSAIRDRQELVQFLHGVSQAQAQWSPPDGEWSIALGLEHIMLTEAFFRRRFLNLLQDAENSGTWDTASDNPVKMSAEALRRREQGVVLAPDELEPSGEREFQQMLGELTADRDTTRDTLLAYRSNDLSQLVFLHPIYGERNLYDVIEYSGIHDALHCEQMGRVTAQCGYPAA